jgi:hypothetical protein
MSIRFLRSAAVRAAYQVYDRGQYGKVINICTEGLTKPGADPELRLLRGIAHLDRNKPAEAVADWETCCEDTHIGGLAHYELGTFLSQQSTAHEASAWEHFERAVALGWVEGHIGKGKLLLSKGFRERDESGDPAAAVDLFRRAVAELTTALASPAAVSRRRAIGIRASVHYNLGDEVAFLHDRAEEKTIIVDESGQMADSRATGGDLFA